MKTDQDVGGDHLVAGEPDDVAHPDVLPETLDVPVETPEIKAKNVFLDLALGNQNGFIRCSLQVFLPLTLGSGEQTVSKTTAHQTPLL